ncbi:hypothetical protein GFJ94_10730 [Flavobacterium sp. LMO8]|uniref:CUB domain-containing protein n=1 Tax=Flavobacterium sp. LMO8 TaxID=2654244 RepID=UPI001290DEF1|nr:CUB domain-containing protein [Flavobacterium sp. LMO8]MQP25539.1 hypothetical protein [Flavobacterium sp. LMO8]
MKIITYFLKNYFVFHFNYLTNHKTIKQFILSCFILFSIISFAQPGFQNGPGSGSFVVPANVTHVTVGAFGGGGGGGGSDSNNNGGSGGGGGGAATATYTVNAGNTFTYTIGGGGAAGINNPAGTGGTGGNTTITSALPLCNIIANGGTGGGPNIGAIGTGGIASGGTTNNNGSNGTIGNTSGQAGGVSGLGLNDLTNLITIQGAGGAAPRTNSNGAGGGIPGGGGSGGERAGGGTGPRSGGAGAVGRVVFNYIVVNSVTASSCIGNTITISGNYFETGTHTVTINGTSCTSVTRVNLNTITAVVAPGTTSGQVVVTSPRGMHNGYSITINSPPTITVQPVAPATVCAGSGTRTMTVTATGATTYQWYKAPATLLTNGALYSGVTTATLTITNPASIDAGNYYVVVGNALGCTVNSNNTALSVGSAPTISSNPANQTIAPGTNTSFSATYSNSPTTFIWEVSTDGGTTWTTVTNGGVYSNATTATLNLTNVPLSMSGYRYRTRSSNTCGTSANSNVAVLTVVAIIPSTGNNTISCGTNSVLYDNGGPSGNYVSNSNGYTVLEAGTGATINISGNHDTESTYDYIRIYDGVGTSGTLLGSYTGSGTLNYTGTAGQTLTVEFTSDGSINGTGFNLTITYSGVCYLACSGTPSGGTVSTSPSVGAFGSNYVVSSSGYTSATNMLYQWQYSTDSGSTWTNAGAATSTYSNYTASAPVLGTVVLWQLVVTCTNSGMVANSSNASFTTVNTLNIPSSGNNTVSCGTNTVLYDNGGVSGNYSNSSNGYTVLEAGLGSTITIFGNYITESIDDINIYSGVGTGGTLLASYSGNGSINFTGAAGQTLTIQFTSDSSVVYSGFSLSVSYSGACFPSCLGTPTGGSASTSPNTGWPGSTYSVTATGNTLALDMLYQWQFSTDGGTSWTNAGAATSTYTNYNGAIAPASGLVHWQLVSTCTNSGLSATSSAGIFTVMTVSTVVTGCPNVVSGGLGLNGADPAAINCVAASTCVDLEATYLDLGDTTDYIVEPIVYNPPFAFTGLANPVSVNTDDVWSPLVNLPFDFCFYGNTFNRCLIGSNGVITFDTTNNTPGGYCGWSTYSPGTNLPVSGHAALIENAIFGVFHDMDPSTAGNVGWELVNLPSGCRALVVAWYNVPMFSNDSANDYTGMLVLYENSNIIEVYIQKKNVTTYAGFGSEPMWNDGNAVIGIQNSTGTLASVPPGRNVLDPNWSTTNEAWRFVPNGTSIASIVWHEGSGTAGPVVGSTPTINVCPTSTTTYTAEITYTLCDGSTIVETDETTVTINGSKVWDGSVNTNWNNANNWTPTGVPTSADCVVIPNTANDPIVSGTNYDALGLNLTIENGAVLTVNTTNDLIITDWVNINAGGDLQLNNSSSLIQINNDVNSGTMHMHRTVNMRRLDYVYWSSPVTSFASSAISPLTPTSYIYKWAPSLGYTVNNHGTWISGNEIMELGKGYIVRGPNNFTTALAPFTATFTGTPNNGVITTPISRGAWNSGSYSTGLSSTLATDHDDNWNLIGNPYPSAVNAISFLSANTNIDGFIKVWTHGTLPDNAIADHFYDDHVYNYSPGDYITYNSSGTSSGPGIFLGSIASGQGFFVSMLHTSAGTNETVTFDNSMRGTSNDNSEFFRNTNQRIDDGNGRIWLDLIRSNSNAVRNLVGYINEASNDRDRMYDAITDEKLDFNLYSKIGDDTMVIQGRALPFDQNDKVSIGYKVPQDGTYSIGIGVVDGFFTNTNQNIYLEDKLTNIIHDLRQSPYSFTSVAGNHDNRFVLRYTNETLGADDFEADNNNIWVINSDVLTVKSTKNEIQSVRVFDIIGRELVFYPEVNSFEIPLSKIQKNNAGLIIQITLTNGTIVNKKIIY